MSVDGLVPLDDVCGQSDGGLVYLEDLWSVNCPLGEGVHLEDLRSVNCLLGEGGTSRGPLVCKLSVAGLVPSVTFGL